MKPNDKYWIDRALQREQQSYLRGSKLSAKLFSDYQAAARKIRREINDFYTRYGGKHGLTYEQAVRHLNRPEMQEWKASLGEYVAKIAAEPDPRVKALLTAELDALSYNSRITRLEALQGQIDLILNDLYDKGVHQMKEEFGAEITESYYQKVYDIQSRVGMINDFAKLSPGMIENIVSYPWSGAMFSDRLWQNKQSLLFNLREVTTQGVITGKSVTAMSKEMADKMGSSYKAAERLIRTETNHFHNAAELAAYDAAGVEQYEYMATLDNRTSAVCGELDGQHFKVEDAQAGVNYPPMHPNCRSTTVEYDPDNELDWYNSGVEMPKNMTYKEWYDQQVAEHGPGHVEKERKKEYNQKADFEQYKRYKERMGKDVPTSFDAFQEMKYSKPAEYDELKSYYSYKGRVPEATKTDFATYSEIKAMQPTGTIRVPPQPIDPSTLTIDAAHIAANGHNVTLEEAQQFIKDAQYSLSRTHWRDGEFTNYYAQAGAAFVNSQSVIRTAFKDNQFSKITKDIADKIKP